MVTRIYRRIWLFILAYLFIFARTFAGIYYLFLQEREYQRRRKTR